LLVGFVVVLVWSIGCREAVASAVRVSDVDLVAVSSRPLGDLAELARV